MSSFDSFFFIYKNSFGNWDTCTNPKFIARHQCCRAIFKSKVRDLKQLKYVCKELNSYNDTFTRRYLIKELEID